MNDLDDRDGQGYPYADPGPAHDDLLLFQRTVSDRSGVVILSETATLESSRSITRSIRRRSFFSKPGIGRARALFTEPSCVPFGDSSRIQQLHIFQKTLGLNDFCFGMDGFEYPVG